MHPLHIRATAIIRAHPASVRIVPTASGTPATVTALVAVNVGTHATAASLGTAVTGTRPISVTASAAELQETAVAGAKLLTNNLSRG